MRASRRLLGIYPILILTITAVAWVYPEHRDIALLALERLEPAKRSVLDQLWSEARVGHEAQHPQGANPACLDYASWTAISGDHSCSAGDMLSSVLDSPWILKVAGVSAHLKSSLATATRPDQRLNAVRESDIALLRADPAYVTRAGSNNAHFLLARPDVAMTAEAYGGVAFRTECRDKCAGNLYVVPPARSGKGGTHCAKRHSP
jgi:hypothetical protein